MTRRRWVVTWAVALALVAAATAGPVGLPSASATPVRAGEAAPTWRTYRPPTEGAVVDPFRPPLQPWLPGNRGIEYATEPGSELVAIGPGTIAFAGPVGGRLVVSIVHPDGLRSSLTGVAAVTVEVGRRVWAGAPIAVAADRTHLGVRRGDAYLDPASLWGTTAGGGSVHLVPVGGGAGAASGRAREPVDRPPERSGAGALAGVGAAAQVVRGW